MSLAIVTGGAGALGASVVRALVSAGHAVAVPYQREGDLDRLRAQLATSPEAKLVGRVVELTEEESVSAAYAAFVSEHGPLVALVNCAGGWDGGKPAHETPWSVWQKQLDLNLRTAVISCRAATPHLIAAGGGSIVNIASRAATGPSPGTAAYATSKSALVAFTETLAVELHDHRITANAVFPSLIDTEANRRAGMTGGVSPDAIANVIRFLVGPDARIISGARVPVAG